MLTFLFYLMQIVVTGIWFGLGYAFLSEFAKDLIDEFNIRRGWPRVLLLGTGLLLGPISFAAMVGCCLIGMVYDKLKELFNLGLDD